MGFGIYEFLGCGVMGITEVCVIVGEKTGEGVGVHVGEPASGTEGNDD
jgi:hypothetical protein